ncbi:MAG TPA: hypothetical protein VHX86_07265 [Tepidisphaeraceae bacterium]|jgi:hypothetical protein|nr:hypothetical protein [Tepidisphaeraceae bacterium]
MAVPAEPPQAQTAEEDDLYALADDAQRAAAHLPPTAVDPAAFMPAQAVAAAAGRAIPLAYQRTPTAQEKELASSKSAIDSNRDLKVPAALLLIGIALYVGYYAVHYNLGLIGICATGLGLTIMTILETAVLICFAMVVAGPLGVSFGGFGTAILKLAAIVVLCDGITTCVDGLLARYTAGIGSGGIFGFGLIDFPVALGVYWTTLIYLFSMDPGDSWMVVVLLAIFDWIVRVVLIVLLLKLILGLGGVARSTIAIPSMGGGRTIANPMIDEVNAAKAQNVLHEAKKYASDNGRRAEIGTINAWYAAGAKNVWYQTSRDINGKGDAFQLVVELPNDAASRAKCYGIAKAYCDGNRIFYDPAAMQDHGDPYLIMGL